MRSRWAPTTVDHAGLRIHIAPKTIPGVARPGRMLSRGTSAAPSTVVATMTVRIDVRRASHGAASEPRSPPTPTNANVTPINVVDAPRSRAMTITTR
jgi:hypothetical protein